MGLVGDKKGYLICAGILLGSNVLVRFSNLPEAAMIVAVWAYDIILWLEGRKRGGRAERGSAGGKALGSRKAAAGKGFLSDAAEAADGWQ